MYHVPCLKIETNKTLVYTIGLHAFLVTDIVCERNKTRPGCEPVPGAFSM